MTEARFMEMFGVSKRTMANWKKKNWIRGGRYLEDGTYYIPNSARPPYSRRSTRCKYKGMYNSLLNGIRSGKDVFPALYGITDTMFQAYISYLVEEKYIRPVVEEGITYYIPLEKCVERRGLASSDVKRTLREGIEIVSPLVEAGARGRSEGTTNAILDRTMGKAG